MMSLKTVLITGANRGIGFQLSKLYGRSGEWNVVATCRAPAEATDLKSLAKELPDRVTVKALDVSSGVSVSNLASDIENQSIDLLINNAGIMGGTQQSLMDMDFDQWAETINVNTMGPLRTVQGFLSNLKQSPHPKIVTISSQMGAMSLPEPGRYAYRSSKSAVNKVMQTLAKDLEADKICVALFHPGWVQTDMGGEQADISPEQSAKGIFSAISNLKLKDSGCFFNWNGDIHSW